MMHRTKLRVTYAVRRNKPGIVACLWVEHSGKKATRIDQRARDKSDERIAYVRLRYLGTYVVLGSLLGIDERPGLTNGV
jgi:hypothetical protein